MSPLTVTEAIARARMLQPGVFIPLDVDFSLTWNEFHQQEAALAFAIVYGHLAPARRG